jgi:hypothetical protein
MSKQRFFPFIFSSINRKWLHLQEVIMEISLSKVFGNIHISWAFKTELPHQRIGKKCHIELLLTLKESHRVARLLANSTGH